MLRMIDGKTVLVACFSVMQFVAIAVAQDPPRPNQSPQEIEARKKFAIAMGRTMVIPDEAVLLLPRTYRQQPTQWENAEKARCQALLATQTYDVLVLPFQVQNYALDRSTRSLMSVQLAAAIAASGTMRVPDPYLVMGALGEGRRRLDVQEFHDLAVKLGVKRIVWSYAGHDRKNHMLLRVQFEENPGTGVFPMEGIGEPHKFENIDFTDESPPIEAFQKVLPELVASLGLPAAPAVSMRPGRFDAATLPATPLGMTSGPSDPAADAFKFHLLAALTPSSGERARERLVEKSMLAVLALPESSPDYRLLKARTFMLMGLRPAALHALGEPKNDEERALQATLNGNLPELTAAVKGVQPKFKRLLAELDLAALRIAYRGADAGNPEAIIQAVNPPGKIWSQLIVRAVSGQDPWAQFDNLALKEVLDAEFPIPGFTAKGIRGGASAVGSPENVQNLVDFSAHDHVLKMLQIEAAKTCCNSGTTIPTPADYLELIEALAFDNLARRVRFQNVIQGNPAQAMAQLSRMESIYKGMPQVQLLRATVEMALVRQNEGPAKEGLLRSAYANAFDAFYREQGQTAVAADAFDVIINSGRSDNGYLHNLYAGDYPFRPFYPTWEKSSMELDVVNARAGLRNSMFDTTPVYRLYGILESVQHKHAEMNQELQLLAGRFHGSSYIATTKAKTATAMGNVRDAEKYFRDALATQAPWDTYHELFQLLLRQGRVEEATQTIMSYPGFRPDSRENRVGLANAAYQAGDRLEWIGELEGAKLLYKIAAELNTGAESSITSAIRLMLLSDDYRGALKGEYERANRYNAPNAYRNYLSMLHAFGYAKEAWDGFDLLVGQFPGFQIWESALVGHQLAGTTNQEIIAWAKQDSFRNSGSPTSQPARYLVMTAIMDRAPVQGNIDAAIAELDKPVWKVADGHDHVVRVDEGRQDHYIVGPAASEGSTLPPGVFEGSKKVRVKSDLAYFLEAYRAMRNGDHGTARSLFQEASTLYDMKQTFHDYMLPYFAFAAAKSGDSAGIDKILGQFRQDQQGFHYFLARAVTAGLAGKTDDSLALLKKGLYSRPYGDGGPVLTEYEFAEICEWLYLATGKAPFRDLAIEWSRKIQKMRPWNAWAYAMEAKLSPNKTDRRRAIAMTVYLDRNSERLRSLAKEEVDAAVKEFANQNPFLRPEQGETKKST